MFSSPSRARPAIPLRVEALEDRCVPSTTQFITALYTNLLHRAPAAAEVSGWVAALNHGTTPYQVALGVTASAEYQSNLIQNDYQIYLGRRPAPAEIAGWLTQLQKGLGELQLQANFLSSDEFFAKHGNALTPWLDGIYRGVLGRGADPAGLAQWSQLLQAGTTRQAVALDIVTSPEAFEKLVTAVYKDLLGRSPDPAGLASWVTQLEQGLTPSQLLAGIVSSDEFINLQGGLNDPGVFVTPVVPVCVFVFDPFLECPVGGFLGFGFTGVGFTGGFIGGFTGGFGGGLTGTFGGGFTGGFTGGSTGGFGGGSS